MPIRARKIIALTIVLFLLGILLYIQNLQRSKQSRQGAAAAVAKTVPLAGWDQVMKIRIEKSPAAGAASRLELQNNEKGFWRLAFPTDIPLRAGAVATLARQALELRGRRLKSDFDLSQQLSRERYGFHQTWLTIDYFGPAELLGRILIGASGIGGYYATVLGKQAGLFLLSRPLVRSLSVEVNSLRKKELAKLALFSSRQEHLEVLELRRRSQVLRIEFKDEDKYPSLNELQSFVMTKPYPVLMGVEQYSLEQFLQNMPNPLRILEYVADQPQDLAVYGLEQVRRQTIYARDNQGNVLDLWLGKEADLGSVYAMEAGYDSVFTVSSDILALFNFEPFEFVDKFVALINIDRVAGVRLLLAGQPAYQFQILQEEERIGGRLVAEKRERRIDDEVTRNLYQKFLSLFLAGEVSNSFFPVDKAELSLVYLLRNGGRRRIDFYNYSIPEYYVLSIDGSKAVFITEKRQLEQLRKTVEQVLQTGELDIVR